MKAKVNYNAYDTWLEPYIGHEFKVKKHNKLSVWFWMDHGYSKDELHHYDAEYFDLIKENRLLTNKN